MALFKPLSGVVITRKKLIISIGEIGYIADLYQKIKQNGQTK